MSNQTVQGEGDAQFVKHKFGARFWALAFVASPVFIDLLLGLANGYADRGVAAGGSAIIVWTVFPGAD